MKELYFENIVNIGNLYLKDILFEFECEPILFICSDDNNQTYICVCSDFRNGQKWVVGKCSEYDLDKLIHKKIDITSVFLKNDKLVVICMDTQGNLTSDFIDSNDIDRLLLPQEGLYLR